MQRGRHELFTRSHCCRAGHGICLLRSAAVGGAALAMLCAGEGHGHPQHRSRHRQPADAAAFTGAPARQSDLCMREDLDSLARPDSASVWAAKISLMMVQVIRDRDIRLYFAGGIHLDDASYSHGVRQTLLLLFNNTPGTRCPTWCWLHESHALGMSQGFHLTCACHSGTCTTMGWHWRECMQLRGHPVCLCRLQAGQHRDRHEQQLHGRLWAVGVLLRGHGCWLGRAPEAGPHARLHPRHRGRPRRGGEPVLASSAWRMCTVIGL